MPRKTMTITLTSGWAHFALGRPEDYRVEKVTDSVDYSPGQMLTQHEVRAMCADHKWRVTIVPYNPK